MNIGAPELLIVLVIFATTILPIWGVIDAAVRPDAHWTAIGQSKIVWVLVQVFLSTIGAIAYFVAIRPKLQQAI